MDEEPVNNTTPPTLETYEQMCLHKVGSDTKPLGDRTSPPVSNIGLNISLFSFSLCLFRLLSNAEEVFLGVV